MTGRRSGGEPHASGDRPESEQVVIRDKRRVSADGTGKEPSAEAPTGADSGAGASTDGDTAAVQEALDELTRDLQRVTAEYANYRKRVDRDRGLVAEQATGAVLAALLPLLDDIDRAREHGDLVGPFGAMAEHLGQLVAKFGLVSFGAKGDGFDPNVHEAVAHFTSPDVTEPTCVDVMRRGYLLGERLLRPAMVAVADPAGEEASTSEVPAAHPDASDGLA